MTAQKETVVTPERIAQGMSWQEWLERIDRNQEKYPENYAATELDPEQVAAIKAVMSRPHGPAIVLCLAEPGCPDVFRGLPVMQKLCEATGLELKILFRDQNLDIMDEFLYKGEFRSMPTFVFYTKDCEYIAHWNERAQKARDEYHLLRTILDKWQKNPNVSDEERERYMAEYLEFQRGPVWNRWRRYQVEEMRELLETNAR